jgi:hypothetical protein
MNELLYQIVKDRIAELHLADPHRYCISITKEFNTEQINNIINNFYYLHIDHMDGKVISLIFSDSTHPIYFDAYVFNILNDIRKYKIKEVLND